MGDRETLDGQLDAARRRFERARDLGEGTVPPRASLRLGSLAYLAKDTAALDAALSEYRGSVGLPEAVEPHWYDLALELQGEGEWLASVAPLAKCVAEAPRNARAEGALSRSLFNLGIEREGR